MIVIVLLGVPGPLTPDELGICEELNLVLSRLFPRRDRRLLGSAIESCLSRGVGQLQPSDRYSFYIWQFIRHFRFAVALTNDEPSDSFVIGRAIAFNIL
jgi:hypothetical protein